MKEENIYKLIDDSGVHEDNKRIQSLIFISLCRIVTAILVILGVAALIKGFM
jgi:hypothetical protein